jgi:hypothetical protein
MITVSLSLAAASSIDTGVSAEVPEVTPAPAREGEGGFDADVPAVGALWEAFKTLL